MKSGVNGGNEKKLSLKIEQMSVTITTSPSSVNYMPKGITTKRIQSIDLLRGTVMIIMVLDHVRDYFNRDAFLYNPTNLAYTSIPVFFTRWITHYCAPIFVFLAGISACLYGAKKSNNELAYYLFTRGLWLVCVELLIIRDGYLIHSTGCLICR